MGQPELTNHTPFAVEALYLNDENFTPLLSVVVKATYDIVSNTHLRFSQEQIPVSLTGEHWGDPQASSFKYEPECAFMKLGTDIVLIGHAYADNDQTFNTQSGIQVGSFNKVVKVFGDRIWQKGALGFKISDALAIDKVPLIYERAFGGHDVESDEGEVACLDPRNPIGMGFKGKAGYENERIYLPNIEDPNNLIKKIGDRPPPAGFGYVSHHWHPRSTFAGTYDQSWDDNRKPLLPQDFDRRYFDSQL